MQAEARESPGAVAAIDEPVVPPEPLGRLFLRYLRFGALAWGGPVAQIAMIRRELVAEKKWVSTERFNRTLAVYQALPGPEAHELCVHYGMLSRGRIGGLLAGLGFLLPGFALMFLLSWMYFEYGLASPTVIALFSGMRPAVVALVVRATHRLSNHALHDRYLVGIAIATLLATILGAPFFVTLPLAGLAYWLARREHTWAAASLGIVLITVLLGFALAGPGLDVPWQDDADTAVGAVRPTLVDVFVSGFKAGALTFGGAYTVIPFLQEDATGPDGWMSQAQFLEGIAIGGILPAPLIIFATFVGYAGAGPLGAIVMTAAIFLPAFAITLAGQRHLDRLIADRRLHDLLDGITAGVIGLIGFTALYLLVTIVTDVFAVAIFVVALGLQYVWKSRAAVPLIVLGSGAAGVLVSMA